MTEGVEEALDELRPGLSGLQTDTSVFRPASLIDEAIDNVTVTLIIACLLLVLVVAAFLFQWRAILIALVTVPVSLVAAALVLDLLGETFNAISFAGLAVALAIVIDDAVVSAENVARRVRAQRAQDPDGSTAEAVLQGSQEMRSPLAYATLIALVTVVPVAIMEGRPGAFFEPLALSYALAVAASMLVAMTLSPALSLMLFSRGSPGGGESPLLRPTGCALPGRAVAIRPQAEGGARRRRCGRGGRPRHVAPAGNVADSLLQGHGCAGPPGWRTGDLQSEDDPGRHGPRAESCGRFRASRTSVPTSDGR